MPAGRFLTMLRAIYLKPRLAVHRSHALTQRRRRPDNPRHVVLSRWHAGRSLRLRLSLRRRLSKLNGLCDDRRREKTREAGAAENGNEEAMREQWTT